MHLFYVEIFGGLGRIRASTWKNVPLLTIYSGYEVPSGTNLIRK